MMTAIIGLWNVVIWLFESCHYKGLQKLIEYTSFLEFLSLGCIFNLESK